MKSRNAVFFALIFGLAALSAQGQSADVRAGFGDDVAVARCAYVSNDSTCAAVNGQPDDDGTVVAQVPRRPPGPPMRRVRPMGPPPGYPGFGPPEHPGHALIGALLLGGLGGSLAYNTHPNGQSGPNVVGALFGGGFGALIGWIIGDHISGGHGSGYHRGGWHDEDEDASVVRSKGREAGKAAVSARPEAGD